MKEKQRSLQEHLKYGIVILAAGTSRRLGSPKQFLLYKGDTLLNNAVKTASQVNTGAVAVVLGAERPTLNVPAIHNPQYAEGMASSIRCGVQYMMEQVENIILMVCDQPHVDAAHLLNVIATHKATGAKIVASYYEDRKGVPALFDQTLFPELLSLSGDTGARHIIEKYAADIAAVPFPPGAIDIDTEEAYQALITARPGM